ncbi:neurogenic locus notch homolog protein 1-like isoform X3 [Nematostella vectensis]|uniref:neurogenic locus notch homolog protein 1-like isoform X3 n=1 Tax=Nematostella vectensis TaxID=45351 RepID=UPI002077084B|nr:neurogenic locus notch homolog protein 1-like isoform X3 [Nematostella vectensis]
MNGVLYTVFTVWAVAALDVRLLRQTKAYGSSQNTLPYAYGRQKRGIKDQSTANSRDHFRSNEMTFDSNQLLNKNAFSSNSPERDVRQVLEDGDLKRRSKTDHPQKTKRIRVVKLRRYKKQLKRYTRTKSPGTNRNKQKHEIVRNKLRSSKRFDDRVSKRKINEKEMLGIPSQHQRNKTVHPEAVTNEDSGKRYKKQGIPMAAFARGGETGRPKHGPKSHRPNFLMPPLDKLFSGKPENRYIGAPIHRYLSKPIDIGSLEPNGGNVRHFGPNPCFRINNAGPCIEGPIGQLIDGHPHHIHEGGPEAHIGMGGNLGEVTNLGGAMQGGFGVGGGAIAGGVTGTADAFGVGGSPPKFDDLDSYSNNRFGAPKIMDGGGGGMSFSNMMAVDAPVHHVDRVPFPVMVNRPVHHTERIPFPVPFVVNRPIHHTVQVPYPVPVRGPSRLVIINRPVPMPSRPVPVPVMVPGPPRIMEYHHLNNIIVNSPCEVSPCRNGGTCSAVGNEYRCVCALGYKGDRCDIQSKCFPNPCKNFATCTEHPNDYECTCHPGFHGKNCDEESKCEPNPCRNGAVCTETREKYICSCTYGFMGKNCEQESKCHPVNPCQNNGVCKEDLDSYRCECNDNYGGINCEARLNNNACQSSPCLNGGTCSVDPVKESEYTCICPNGFSGQTCQDTASSKNEYYKEVFLSSPGSQPCDPNPCLYGGRCIPAGYRYVCICPDDRNGRHCEVLLSRICDRCSRHALCVDDKCVCRPGFSGNGFHCRRKKVHCHPNPCENGGTCHEQNHMYSTDSDWWCECNKGYTGQTCTQYDPCTGFNCHNGGRCQSSGGIPTCTCIAPYTGATCELDNPCLPMGGKSRDPCQNGGTCQFINNQVVCLCPKQYDGTDCSKNKCDRCDPNASCYDGSCRCRPQWTGDGYTCTKLISANPPSYSPTVPVTYCVPNPCENGATCIEGKTTFYCICTEDFYGRTCASRRSVKVVYKYKEHEDSYRHHLCHPNPCLHGGICKEISGNDYECICANPRYKGRFCDVDLCSECDAHARCIHGKCYCREGYEGDGYSCTKIPTDECKGGCPLYATCESNVCVCQPGTTACCQPVTTPCSSTCPAGKRVCIPLPPSPMFGHTKALSPFIAKDAKAITKALVLPTSKAANGQLQYSSRYKPPITSGLLPPTKAQEWSEDIIVTEYQSLGCWADTPNWRNPHSRALISLEGLDAKIMDDYHRRKQPISKCAEIARDLGYKIFAIQNGGQCFSGARDYRKYGPSELCKNGVGGNLANDVYKL